MIELKFTGPAHEVLDEMLTMLRAHASAPEVGLQLAPAVACAQEAKSILATYDEADERPPVEEKAAPVEEPKRKRRTKAEIEAEKTANISATPEDRVDPEVEAQDAADEAAETASIDEAPKIFSRDDVRSRMTTLLGLMPGNEAEKYAKFASLATPIFNAVLGNPPDGENWRIGLIADNAEHFALLCEGFDIAIRGASNG
jgi:hypothetical protein